MAYFFKLPQIPELTPDQRKALNEINPISLSGGAGTGKTVVSLYRHIQMIEDLDKYTVLVTYTKTLGFYIRMSLDSTENKEKCIKNKKAPPSEQVFIIKDFPFNQKWFVQEIIIDEAQDLKFDILKQISQHAEVISFGADFNQQLYTDTVTEEEMEEIFPNNEEYPLQQNFRNTYYILNFVKSMLPTFSINQNSLEDLKGNRLGIKPILFVTNGEENEIDKIVELIKANMSDTHNIAILLPFGNSGDESVENYHTLLSNKNINCSKYYNEMRTDNIEISNIHITTFKSSKGLEFDTVIIPFIDKYKAFIERSKYTRVNEEDYYVAFTRTKTNLYLFTNKELNFISDSVCDIKRIDAINMNTSEIPF